MSNKIDAKDVEIFLLDNLDFFESRESLVGELKFKHSSSSASSLLERQIIKLRDEQKDLMDLLSSFVKEASVNEDLFNKSKDLTLSILGASSREDIIKRVQDNFHKSFNVDKCLLSLHDNSEINDLEQKTGMSFHKGAIHCGSYSTEKMELLFEGPPSAPMWSEFGVALGAEVLGHPNANAPMLCALVKGLLHPMNLLG